MTAPVQFFKPVTVARMLDCSRVSVLRYIRAGQLRAVRLKVGESSRIEYRVPADALDEFVARYCVPVEIESDAAVPVALREVQR